MKIISWNIRQGGGKRIEAIIINIVKYNSDIIILTEYRNNENGLRIRQALLQKGYLFQYCPIVEKNINTVFIATKNDFSTSLFYNELQKQYFRVVKIYNSKLTIYGLYFPQREEKKKIFDFMINETRKNKAVFIGDFNTGKHYIDEYKKTFVYSDYFDTLEKEGLVDVWRSVNLDKREYSWYSNSNNGFRIDHAFINKDLKENIKNCYYSHEERTEKISDHSLMVLDIEM